MTVLDAALRVLREMGRPLTAREITERVLATGLWNTTGRTPVATVAAQLYTNIQRRGEKSPFVLVGPQTFGLRELGAQPAPLKAQSRHKTEGPSVDVPVSPSQPSGPPCSFTDAAERVLHQFGDRKPMHYRDITRKALELGWIETEGRTPAATMYAQILTEIRRRRQRGREPRFVQHGRGYVGLARWMGRGLTFDIEQHNRRVRQSRYKALLDMEPADFEELIGRLLAEIGFEDIEVTQRSRDGGIDVRGTLVVGGVIRTRMAVQVKRWQPRNRVQAPTVQQVRGSLGTHEQGLIITTSDFTPGARHEADRPNAVPVALMNGEQLVDLLVAHGIGVQRESHDILELDAEFDRDSSAPKNP